MLFQDRVFRVPRCWSNKELRRFASLFTGRVVNVSGWKDDDKQGGRYEEYFLNASEYHLTNHDGDEYGFQGDRPNEILLDLSHPLAPELVGRFDVAFCHTVLEHIFEVFSAFEGVCGLSNDIVILVVPFLQSQHTHYGDYWRFTPLAIDGLFRKNGLQTVYLSYNDGPRQSIYVFAIGSRRPADWRSISDAPGNRVKHLDRWIGTRTVRNSVFHTILNVLRWSDRGNKRDPADRSAADTTRQ